MPPPTIRTITTFTGTLFFSAAELLLLVLTVYVFLRRSSVARKTPILLQIFCAHAAHLAGAVQAYLLLYDEDGLGELAGLLMGVFRDCFVLLTVQRLVYMLEKMDACGKSTRYLAWGTVGFHYLAYISAVAVLKYIWPNRDWLYLYIVISQTLIVSAYSAAWHRYLGVFYGYVSRRFNVMLVFLFIAQIARISKNLVFEFFLPHCEEYVTFTTYILANLYVTVSIFYFLFAVFQPARAHDQDNSSELLISYATALSVASASFSVELNSGATTIYDSSGEEEEDW